MMKVLILSVIAVHVLWTAWQFLFRMNKYKQQNAVTVTIETPNWRDAFRDIAVQKNIRLPSTWSFVSTLFTKYPPYRYYVHARDELRKGESCACLIIPAIAVVAGIGYALYRILR